jgi:hypothetical protein
MDDHLIPVPPIYETNIYIYIHTYIHIYMTFMKVSFKTIMVQLFET